MKKLTLLALLSGISLNVALQFGFGTTHIPNVFPKLAEFSLFTFSEWSAILSGVLSLFCVVVVLAPCLEELVFRGVLQRLISARAGSFIGILVSTLVFAFCHGSTAFLIIPAGLLFSAWYDEVGLDGCVPAHIGFNLSGFIFMIGASIYG